MKINIAIDGYSSCGKSTVAKAIAKELGYTYIDSGAMYRAITYYLLQNKIDLNNTNAITQELPKIKLTFQLDENGNNYIHLNNQNVEKEIRTMEVANAVSAVATNKQVRQFAVAQQQQLGASKGVVMDGRDIGSVVFPDAELKIFMTANMDVRVQRRFNELFQNDPNISIEEVTANLALRDHIDTTRAIDPLQQTKDAIILDNSNMDERQQLKFVLDYVYKIIENSKY